MSAQRHQSNQEYLKNFIPLNTLPSARLTSICDQCHVEELGKGTVLFEQGDEAKEFIYLISGMISLYAGEMEVETIVTGSEVARFAIAHHLPRKVKAVTRSKARVVRIPTHMLDMETPEDDGQTYMVDEVEDQGGDWMTTMLQSPVFQRLPAANLQKVMMQMEEVAFAAGEVVVKQGDEADFYYIIKAGDCELIRQPSEQARPIKLGELHSCDAFGEDALLSGNPRNVTVRMKGKGQMLRLSKANFIKLVKEPVLQYVKLEEGQEKVAGGANWLDVRGPDEFAEGHIEEAVNIPFFSLRMKVSELRHDQLQVLVCANGRTSEAAAFLLLKFGFNALILKGGMAKWADDAAEKDAPEKPLISADKAGLNEETSAMTAVVSAPEEPSSEQTKNAQNKIIELEKLCAQSNEKLNKLTIERDNLQQQYDQQSNVVSELQLSSELIADELTAIGASNEGREAEVDQLLSLEREKITALETELGQFRESIDILSGEVSVKDDELITLNAALKDAEKQQEKIAGELAQQSVVTQQEVTELLTEKESLSVRVEEAKCENEQLSHAKSVLEQQIAQLVQDANLGVSEKEARISELNAELSRLRSNLANIEQSKVDQDARLLEQTAELKHVKESEKKASEALKAESAARIEEFEDELSFLKQALTEKTAHLDEHKKLTEEFKAQVDSLKQQHEQAESALEKSAEELTQSGSQVQKLEQESEGLSEQVKRLEVSLSEVSSGKESIESELAQRLENSDNKLASALAQVDSLKEKNQDAESVISEKNVDIEVFTDQLKAAETNIATLQEQQAATESALAEKEALLASSEEKLLSVDGERGGLNKKLEQSDNELSSLLAEQTELEKRLNEALKLTDELKSNEMAALTQVDSLKQQHEQAKDALETSAEELTQSNAQVKKLERESEALSEQVKRLEVSLDEISSGKESIESELAQRLEHSGNELASTLAQVDSLKQQHEQAESALETSAEELTQSNAQVKKLEQESEALGEQVQRLEVSLDEISSGKESIESELAQRLEHSGNELASTLAQVDSLKQQHEQAKDALETSAEELTQSNAQVKKLEQESEALGEQVQRLEVSLSEVSSGKESIESELAQRLEHSGNELASTLAQVDSLKQQHEQAESALETSAEELTQSNAQVKKLEQESEALSEQVKRLEVSLSEVSSGKESIESELAKRLDDLDNKLSSALESKQTLEEQLETASNEKEQAQQKLLALEDQLDTRLGDQQRLNGELTRVREELVVAGQEREKEQAALSESLLQANVRVEEAEGGLKQLSEEQMTAAQQLVEVESNLSNIKEVKATLELTLDNAISEKESAQQQVETALDEQRQLKEQLSQAQQLVAQENKEREKEQTKWEAALELSKEQHVVLESSAVEQAKQAEEQHVEQLSKLENELERVNSDLLSNNEELVSMRTDNEALQQKVVDAESILSASTGDQKELLAQLDDTRLESAEFKKGIEAKQAEVDVLNEQLAELKNHGQQSGQEIQTLTERVQTVEKDLSSTVTEKEGLLLQLEEFEQRRSSGDGAAKALQQKVSELEKSLQQLEEEKELLMTNASKDSDEKVAQLTEQLLAAQSEAKNSLKQLDDANSAGEAEEKEKLELEEKLKVMADESAGLHRKLKDAERVAAKNSDNSADQARIQELEEQLNEASTMLLDLEIKMETSLVAEDAGISDEETNELKALQSELDLVREQTEKDIQAMQVKVENSEKMNLALKRKMLSMQTLANQDVLPEEPPQGKKKGWWK